ncbi:MAG TPA: hypothetical protein VGW74_06930 [Propionibacteriaceae bacterium]|nr:hypothetical protein [Propionibacteriaceae bacterium]
MARIRSVHPDICQDLVLCEVSARAERTFVRLWTHLDDEGRCVDHPKLIKAALYPLHDEMTAAEVDADIWELIEHGLLLRYEADGKKVVAAKPEAWKNRQKPKHPTPSKLPEPPADYTPPSRPTGTASPQAVATSPTPTPNGAKPHPGFTPAYPETGESVPESLHGVLVGGGAVVGGGEGGRAPERSGPTLTVVPAAVSPPAVAVSKKPRGTALEYPADFEAWWVLYPRKVAKPEAFKSWKAALGHAGQADLTDGLRRWCAVWKSQRRTVDKVPHASTWLNQRRWEDDTEGELAVPVGQAPRDPKGYDGIRAFVAGLDSA